MAARFLLQFDTPGPPDGLVVAAALELGSRGECDTLLISAAQLLWEETVKLPHRRQFLHLAAGATALPVASRIARAQTYPNKPIRLIIGFPPGSAVDILGRIITQWLTERLGQQVIVE